MTLAFASIIFLFIIIPEAIIKADNVSADAICSHLYEAEFLSFAASVYC